jgi:hypothetical protein
MAFTRDELVARLTRAGELELSGLARGVFGMEHEGLALVAGHSAEFK